MAKKKKSKKTGKKSKKTKDESKKKTSKKKKTKKSGKKVQKKSKKTEKKMEKNKEKTKKKESKKKATKKKKTKDESKKKTSKKKKSKKKVEKKIKKKDKAVAKGKDLPISTKDSVAISKFIRGKKIGKALKELNKVLEKKLAIPMKGELPHRKGIERGRYPQKACKYFIKILKSLSANSSVNGLINPYIATVKADIASRPYRRFGSRRFKRTNLLMIAKELNKTNKKK